MVNIRTKGASAERDICKALNSALQSMMTKLNYPPEEIEKAANSIQRNQNQTAVGGNDLTNTFGLSIEVKRQEALSINTWWKQCEAAARRNNEIPVLLYKQSRKPWKCVMYLGMTNEHEVLHCARAEIDFADFLEYFENLVYFKLLNGYQVKL